MPKKISAFVFLFSSCFAAFELQSVNTVSIALGNMNSLYPSSLNPAAQVECRGKLARFDYARIFNIKGLDYYETRLSHGFRGNQAAGISMQIFGNSLYQEKTFETQYARRLLEMVSIGLAVRLYHISITGYQNSVTAGVTMGVCYYLNERLTLATLFQNVNNPKIYRESNQLPQCYSLGVRYRMVPQIELYAELFKDIEFPFNPKGAILLQALPILDIMLGIQYHPNRYSGGLSFHWRKLRFDLALQHHMVLPYTLYCGFGIGF
jgi:hypothetical protein